MTYEEQIFAALDYAVKKAINEIGLAEFKKCSFFMSNQKR